MPKIFISRNLPPNSSFRKELTGSGMEIIGQSLIQFSPTLFNSISVIDWIFFYSKNGVKFFLETFTTNRFLHILSEENISLKWAAMGEGTAEALLSYKIQPDFIGNGQPKATAQAFGKIAKGQKVLFPRAKNSKQSIQQLLAKQIKQVDLVVYENEVKSNLAIPFCEILVFTSPLNAQAYFQKYPINPKQKVIAIGKTTHKELLKIGLKDVTIASQPTEKRMAAAVKQVLLKILNYQSMSNRYAVIDLGTNTFHLLVAEKQVNQTFTELHRQRFFVKLAAEGIETIGDASIQRGLHALKTFRATLDKLGVTKVSAIGTAALRTASNGPAFVRTAKEKYNIQIELIDGNREAELIYKGAILAVPFEQKNYLIMDIGGGSVEFIIGNQDKILWAQSFPIGVAVLFKRFHHSNPIKDAEINALQAFLNSVLESLYQALIKFPTTTLVGASGTFDVLEFILAKNQPYKNHAFVQVKDFAPLYQTLIKSTEAERYAMKEVPDTRADLIVVAIALIEFILKKVGIEEIIVSNFALKEGILSELME